MAHDIARITAMLKAVRPAPRVKLDIRKGRWGMGDWHNDHTHVRALACYRGSGTQWVANEHVTRFTGAHGQLYVASTGSVPQDAPVHTVKTGSVVFLTGSEWKGGTVLPIAHRQPPDCGEERLMVVIDLDPE
jgi:hypothetical protein